MNKLFELIEFEKKFAEENSPIMPHANIIINGKSYPIFIPETSSNFVNKAIKTIVKMTIKEDYDIIVLSYEGEVEEEGKTFKAVTIIGMDKKNDYRICRIYKRINGKLDLYKEYENEEFDKEIDFLTD